MVFVVVRLFEVYFGVVSGNFKKFPIQILPEFGGDDRVSVFGRKHYVVVTEVGTMIVPLVALWFVHPFIVA